jgi:hypothetical protein
MARRSLRSASVICIAIWGAIWLLFFLVRHSTFDVSRHPSLGSVALVMLVTVAITPIAATGLAVAAVVRRPTGLLNWITLGCAIAALSGQIYLFSSSRWL